MTPSERLEAIRKRAEAATPEPWVERPDMYDDWGVIRSDVGDRPCVCDAATAGMYGTADLGKPEGPSPIPENRAFIAHARSDIPWLLAEVARLTAAVEAEREHIAGYLLSHAATLNRGDIQAELRRVSARIGAKAASAPGEPGGGGDA